MYKSWMWKQRSYREQFQDAEGGAAAGGAATTDDQAQDQQQAEDETPDAEQQAAPVDQQAADDGEVVITIGDEAPPASNDDEIEGKPAPAWVKELRKEARELKKRNRELEQEKASREAANAPAAPTVGEKPTLESCDYDAETYAEKLLSWTDAKRKADDAAKAARAEQEAAQAAWQKKLDGYKTAAASLKVEDFDGAEHVVREVMNQTQLAIMLNGADKPEVLVYALGRSPAKAKELAAIKDPVKFAFAVAKLETQIKATPKAAPPAPERAVRGTAGGSISIDNARARLEAEADRTGDRSKLIAYDRNKRRQQAA
jgi:hypothetical protein